MDTIKRLFDLYDNKCEAKLKSKLSGTSFNHLTFNHYEYLHHIHGLDQPTLSELADHLKLSKPSVTVMVNKLLKEGFLSKVQDEKDKRVFHVKLSPLGLDVIMLERESFYEVTQGIMDRLSLDEQGELMKLLEKGLA